MLALHGLGVPKGQGVVFPALCCHAVLAAVQFAGYAPVMADIDGASFNTTPATIAAALDRSARSKVGAILAVHGYGRDCCIAETEALAEARELPLIEDACLSFGGREAGGTRFFGSRGQVTVISFGYDKPVAAGYGGALLTDSAEIAARVESALLQNAILRFDPDHPALAAILQGLDTLDAAIQERRSNSEYFESAIVSPHVSCPSPAPGTAYWRYPCRVHGNRARFLKAADAAGLIFTTHYSNLARLGTDIPAPVAEEVSDSVINLFVRGGTPRDQMVRMVDFINSYN